MFEVKEPSLEKKIDDLVKRTVDFMMSLQFTSGNCPIAMCWEAKKLKHPGDKIVRWSQGAPGWIYIYVQVQQYTIMVMKSFLYNVLLMQFLYIFEVFFQIHVERL